MIRGFREFSFVFRSGIGATVRSANFRGQIRWQASGYFPVYCRRRNSVVVADAEACRPASRTARHDGGNPV
jgi:hypothetical protein